ncbi:conserved phage C-terminal domain-containing protein, partial [Klebsiella pneumoniae]|uniref:conserved phage C-terminal domain-containing protein n=1 Tax=Klebsiella pneumoniae TaxID=573 RepID=UPI003A80F04D
QAKPDNTLNKTVDEVISYLNKKADKNYRNSQYARRHINARLNEGYTIEDFNKVVDNKVADWKGNKEFDKFLRPQTLFGNKFESYLNEKPMKLNRTESRESFTQGLGW